MRRRFNITGFCNPQKHYMIRLNDRLKRVKEDYIDEGKYFVINRGRQYGKTTTLRALEEYLKDEYIVISLDFQLMGTEDFSDEGTFKFHRKVRTQILPAIFKADYQRYKKL